MKIKRSYSSLKLGIKTALAVTGMAMLLICSACDQAADSGDSSDDPSAAEAASASEKWQCRNDLEVSCSDGACNVEPRDAFTPMSVNVDDSGMISACAYSGCWEGTGEVFRSGDFLILAGQDLKFSTAPDSESAGADVVIAIDRSDMVATFKAGTFAHPLLCDRL